MAVNLAPHWLWPLIAAPAIGSFLGVLALRLPAGKGVAWGRSACPHCATRLGLRDLVPVLSWAVQRGRCRHCGAALGWFYPAMELAALAVALWATLALPGSMIWIGCLLGWWLLTLAAVDAREMILPDLLTLPLILAGLAVTYLVAPDRLAHHLAGAGAGFAVIAAIGYAYRRLRGRDGIGLGDAKLAAAAGAWVGWIGLPGVILIAALAGIAAVLLRGAADGRIEATRRIAFGPFVALATWVIWVHGPLMLG